MPPGVIPQAHYCNPRWSKHRSPPSTALLTRWITVSIPTLVPTARATIREFTLPATSTPPAAQDDAITAHSIIIQPDACVILRMVPVTSLWLANAPRKTGDQEGSGWGLL